jgi:hypothetical protein
VETGDMVDMEVAEKETDRFLLRDVTVCPGNSVSGIEDEVVFACLGEHGNRIAGLGIEPSVGTKEGDLHIQGVWIHDQKKKPVQEPGIFVCRLSLRSGDLFPIFRKRHCQKILPSFDGKIHSLTDHARRHEKVFVAAE